METRGEPYAVVVDDDAIILMDAAYTLEEAGFRVFTAMDANEAVSHLTGRAEAVTVLFTDVDMPGAMDGFALARFAAKTWPDITILVASGQRRPGPTDMPPGATFVPKPFSAELVHLHLSRQVPEDRQPEALKQKSGCG